MSSRTEETPNLRLGVFSWRQRLLFGGNNVIVVL